MKNILQTRCAKTKRFITASVISLLCYSYTLLSQTFPDGFSQVKVATVTDASAMAFAPDGRLFVCQKSGTILIVKNGTLLSTPFITLTVDVNGERGISGITFDPNFNSNHYVYIYYTPTTPTIHNRLSRFTVSGDEVVAGSELALLDAEPVTAVFHDGGGLGFGPDGKLYLSMGEDNKPDNAQNPTTYKGKLLRLNPDGSAPSDNPYISSSSPITKKIWSYGLRNPYTLAIQPGTGKIFINNVGSDYWEEINDATTPGKNFGWPVVEGNGTNTAYTNPVFAYPHTSSTGQRGCAIVGGTFFNPSSTNYPAQYLGKYFYMDYCTGWMYYLTLGNTVTNTFFAGGLTTKNLALKVGPDGNLYYLNRDPNKAGIYKIIYSTNNAPVITDQPDDVTVSAGQPASFTVSVSGTSPFTYQWKKNGTNIIGATNSIYTINNVQSSNTGQYSVKVSNSYGSATSNAATLTVTAFNEPPVAHIISPAAGIHYHAGDTIHFSGSAADTEDGNLSASAFEWTVEFWHNNNHFHPGPDIAAGIKNGSFVIPNTGEISPNVFYKLKLKVTDSDGLIDTENVDILPYESTITLNSVPSGLQITYDDQPKAAPFSAAAVQGMLIPIGVVSPQNKDTLNYAFNYWQHGGDSVQTVTIGSADSTYTAFFKENGKAINCISEGKITREYWNVTSNSLEDVPFNTSPAGSSLLMQFEGPVNAGDNYGSRIRGYICPPITGDYIFWIASDNNSELWLSSNNDPMNKQKIASVPAFTSYRQWTKYSSQQSAAIHLNAGTEYYIEAIHREGTQADHLSVGWQLPNTAQERPIPGNRLSSYTEPQNSPPAVQITSPTNNFTHSTPTNITINATASSATCMIKKVEFFQGTIKIGEDSIAPYSYTWTNVTTGNYTLKAIATDDNNMMGSSTVVNVIVTSCATPIITAAGPTTMCSGSVLLKANAGSGYVYQWKKDGNDINGATASTYTASSSGYYQVKIIQGSCISWSSPTRVQKENGLSASITPGGSTTFCTGGHILLYANTCAGYTYQWKKNNIDIAGAASSTYTAYHSGNYQVKITQNGNDAWSSQLTVNETNCSKGPETADLGIDSLPTNISEPQNSFLMKVYPNPTTGLFTIVLNMPSDADENIKLKITNLVGQEIFNKDFFARDAYIKESVELNGSLPSGIYTLQVVIGNKVENTSLILSH